MPTIQTLILLQVSNDSHINPVPQTPTPPPFGHLREHSNNAFPNPHNIWRKEEQTLLTPWSARGLKKTKNLFTALNLSFHNRSPIHLTADRLQSKIKCLASRLEPVLFPLPLHPLSPYPCLSVWPISRDDCLSASSPSVRLGRSTLLASGSPQPDRPEHSMAASWHKAHTKL